MKKKIMISAIVASVFLGTSAQINSTLTDGYQERAIFMYQDKNYNGCIDQMSRLLQMNPSMQQKETAKYYIAISSLMKNNKNAEALLTAFLCEYPTSRSWMVTRNSIPATIPSIWTKSRLALICR